MSVTPSAVELTKSLLRENTCTGTIDVGFVHRFVGQLEQIGFTVLRVQTGEVEHLAASIGPRDAKLRVAFVGHYDTVPVGSGWTHPPLEGVVVDGTMYGRGASDMKSGDAAMICAAVQLANEGVRSTVFLPGDEETASLGMPALLEAIPERFDYCICGEPTSKKTLGDCVKVGRRGVVRATVSLLGQAGHAAYAEMNPNIVNQLPAVITALNQKWNDSTFGSETTVSITDIRTDSPAMNVIPGKVELTLDIRFSPSRSLDEVKAEISRRLNETLVPHQVEFSKGSTPYLTDGFSSPGSDQARLVQTAIHVIESTLGVTPKLTCDGGASDARFVAALGVPTIEFGVPHGNMHGPNEFVEVENIERLQDVLQRIVTSLL